jgi:DNA-binding NarL/FixJ family response regulator
MTTPDETKEFTDLQFQFIFGACAGLTNREIAKQCEIGEETVMNIMASVFDKTGMSNRLRLIMFVRDALNNELRRRLGDAS